MLIALIDLYSLVVLASVILSWVRLDPDNAIVRVVRQLTEPLLSRVRQILPATGGIDFSPMLVLLGLQLLKGLLVRL